MVVEPSTSISPSADFSFFVSPEYAPESESAIVARSARS